MDPHGLADLLGDWGYALLLALLAATGVGSPIPEDLLLVTAGYLTSAGVFSWPVVLVIGLTGVVGSDLMLYVWGRRLRDGVGSRWMRGLVRPGRLGTAANWLGRFGDGMVFIARLVPGTRSITFIGAGVRRMPAARFFVLDLLGALIWVPLMLTLGAQVGAEIGGIDRLLASISRIGGWLLLGALLLLVAWQFWRSEESKL